MKIKDLIKKLEKLNGECTIGTIGFLDGNTIPLMDLTNLISIENVILKSNEESKDLRFIEVCDYYL